MQRRSFVQAAIGIFASLVAGLGYGPGRRSQLRAGLTEDVVFRHRAESARISDELRSRWQAARENRSEEHAAALMRLQSQITQLATAGV